MLHVGNEGDKIKCQKVEANTDGESQDGKGKKMAIYVSKYKIKFKVNTTRVCV